MNDTRTMKVTPVDETTSDLLLINPSPDRADRLIKNCDKDLAAEMAKRWNSYDKLVNKLRRIEQLLHDGQTAEQDGEVVQAVREREGDYLSALTDIGADLKTFLEEL